jgi:alpha,alpha-trehalase
MTSEGTSPRCSGQPSGRAMTDLDPYNRFKQTLCSVPAADTLPPSDRYAELFRAVQLNCIFEDSKTFTDCVPRGRPEDILTAYRKERGQTGFDLAAFVKAHFEPYEMEASDFVSDPDRTLTEHIDYLWTILARDPQEHPAGSSLLPLPHRYVVPGGRFTELYYWDSYFVMLGLEASGERELLRCMADNFAYLIETYGHVPNGNRTYYLSRSQPPVFALMTELFEKCGVHRASDYLPHLHREYDYWMEGHERLREGEAHRRCVRLEEGSVLNRYWDDRDTPRDESYWEDIHTAEQSSRPAHEVYRDLRAGAESGWDFSSRWLGTANELSSIRTTSILPVDLNCLLHRLETQIAKLSEVSGDRIGTKEFVERAEARRAAIDRYLWNEKEGAYFDFDWSRGAQRENLTAATVTPLFLEVATARQGEGVAKVVQARLLAPGGLASTEISDSGEQWDEPNGWAPLQWMGIRGLEHYGHHELAKDLQARWLELVSAVFERESKLVEKYDLHHPDQRAGGGEYPLQDGFGWSNAVARRLMQEDPAHRASRCRAGCQGTVEKKS